MKKIFVLAHDYWHHADTIEPMMKLIFDDDSDVTFTTNPADYMNASPDLFVSFKDPIENNQTESEPWCDDAWIEKLLSDTNAGMGALIIHAALADLKPDHKLITELHKAYFVTHPEQCKVSFAPIEGITHPLLEGVGEFEFPGNDEHYEMNFLNGGKTVKDAELAGTTLIAETKSFHGSQPALWYHDYGKGKVCCITPAHTTENLTYAPFVRLVKNAVKWCTKVMLLKNGDLIIRDATKDDVPILLKWWNDGNVMAFEGFPNGYGISAEEIIQILEKYSDNTGHQLIIEYKGKPIGDMNYENVDDNRAAIGIKICEESEQNHGLGTILCSMLIKELFSRGFEKIVLHTNLENERAQHVYEKLGFRKLGIHYDACENQLGELQSFVRYELTESEFRDFS